MCKKEVAEERNVVVRRHSRTMRLRLKERVCMYVHVCACVCMCGLKVQVLSSVKYIHISSFFLFYLILLKLMSHKDRHKDRH